MCHPAVCVQWMSAIRDTGTLASVSTGEVLNNVGSDRHPRQKMGSLLPSIPASVLQVMSLCLGLAPDKSDGSIYSS